MLERVSYGDDHDAGRLLKGTPDGLWEGKI